MSDASRDNIRLAHQCSREDCDSPAEFQAVLHLYYGLSRKSEWTRPDLSLPWKIKVCTRHQKAARKHITSDVNKRVIATALAQWGYLGINWQESEVKFFPVTPSGEGSWKLDQMTPIAT